MLLFLIFFYFSQNFYPMKYIVSILLLCFVQFSNAQAPYLRTKVVVPVKLILPNGTKWDMKPNLKKGKSVLLILFSPDCDHCKKETEELTKDINQYKNIQIVMATTVSMDKMKSFINEFKLNKYPQITVGQDYTYTIPVFFDVKNLPFHAFYSKDKKFITKFEGDLTTNKILSLFNW